MNRRARPSRLVATLVIAMAAGCAGARRPAGGASIWVGAAGPSPESRDELLVATGDAVWRGDLGAAHAALTRLADREQGVADTALDFWSELLALLRCEPLTRTPRATRGDRSLADPWDGLRRLVQIERVRLGREGLPLAPVPAVLGRADGGASTAREVVWPVEGEHWTDELPVPAVISRCAAAPGGAPATEARATPPGDPEVALVAGAASALPSDHPAKALLLVQTAVLELARGEARAALASLARFERLAPSELTPVERGEAVVAAAIAAISDPSTTPEVLLPRGRAALAVDVRAPARRALALLLSERLAAAGRADDATVVLGAPPHGDDAIGRYIAFRQVEAHARAGRRAELLAEARELLHRRPRAAVEEDPVLAAVTDLALRTLLASPVSAETLEVLESLGPPRERLGRAEAFAQVALEAGAYQSAMATFLWLRDNDTDPARQLQHLARASVAAARAGDRGEFARTFRLLAGQDDSEDEPRRRDRSDRPERSDRGDRGDRADRADRPDRGDRAGGDRATASRPTARPRDGALIASAETERAREKRRATRSVNWQRALLVVARDALPALVDNDDQSNLATLVDTLKRHLGDGGRGPVDEQLTTLYRAASAHLKSGARAYAETVGASRRPILLGDVLVGRKYDVRAPRVDLAAALDEMGPVVFVPRRGNDPSVPSLERWPAAFGVTWTGRGL